MQQQLNQRNPIVLEAGKMSNEFRDYLLKLEQRLSDAESAITVIEVDRAKNEGWKDNFANLTAAATGAGTPSLQPFGPSGNAKQRRFGNNDSVYVVWHIDHDVKVGSTAYMHVHWATNGTSQNPVRWQINYTYAKGHNQESFPADSTVEVEEDAQGTAWRHMVTEDTVGFTIPQVDSLVIAEVKRIAAVTGPANADDVFGLFVDIHYESDRDATPERAPDFYAGE